MKSAVLYPPFLGKYKGIGHTRYHPLRAFRYSKPLTPGYRTLRGCSADTYVTQTLASGELGHAQTNKCKRDPIYASLIIILPQQPPPLDAQHTPGEYKTTIPSLLLATRALRCLRNRQFCPDYGYRA